MRFLAKALISSAVLTATAGSAWAENMNVAPRINVQIKARSDGTIRGEVQLNRNNLPQDAYAYVTYAIATKAKSLGFSRFAIIKATGGTLLISGINAGHLARIVAKPLGEDEQSPLDAQGPVLIVDQVLDAPLPQRRF